MHWCQLAVYKNDASSDRPQWEEGLKEACFDKIFLVYLEMTSMDRYGPLWTAMDRVRAVAR